MKQTKIGIRVQFTEPLLGCSSGNPEIYDEFLAPKAEEKLHHPLTDEQKAEERAAITPEDPSVKLEKASTVFPKDTTGLFVWDYQWRGFIKERIGSMIELGDVTEVTKWTYKRAVDQFVFVNPRRCYLHSEGGEIVRECKQWLQRPLRATTMQGDRIALARSQMLPVGTTCEFAVTVMEGTNPKSKVAGLTPDRIRQCFDMGIVSGSMQWRSGGWGRFTWSELPVA